jgi:hypothetical protein
MASRRKYWAIMHRCSWGFKRLPFMAQYLPG